MCVLDPSVLLELCAGDEEHLSVDAERVHTELPVLTPGSILFCDFK